MATIISNVYAFDSMRYFEVNRRRQRVLMSLAELHAIKGLIFLQYSLKITAVNIIFPQISANSAYLPQTWAKWAVLAVLFSWQLRILIFSIVMVADYSFELISIETKVGD